jgi:hypothetical protein
MTEDIFFLDNEQVKVTAAAVGISRIRWTHVREEDISSGKYIELMKENRFDHLPIVSSDNVITHYYKTDTPNDYDVKSIKKHRINYEDILPLDTNIKDVIEKFAHRNRTFFFLSYHRNIAGLITLGNLNCKQVQVYIFSLICELERELAEFVNYHLTALEIIEWVTSKVNKDDPQDKYQSMLKFFESLASVDLENKLTEHFFLVDLINIIIEKGLYSKLSYSKDEWKKLGGINELRKRIAHPTRTLLDRDNDIQRLWKRICKVDDLIFRLISYRKSTLSCD